MITKLGNTVLEGDVGIAGEGFRTLEQSFQEVTTYVVSPTSSSDMGVTVNWASKFTGETNVHRVLGRLEEIAGEQASELDADGFFTDGRTGTLSEYLNDGSVDKIVFSGDKEKERLLTILDLDAIAYEVNEGFVRISRKVDSKKQEFRELFKAWVGLPWIDLGEGSKEVPEIEGDVDVAVINAITRDVNLMSIKEQRLFHYGGGEGSKLTRNEKASFMDCLPTVRLQRKLYVKRARENAHKIWDLKQKASKVGVPEEELFKGMMARSKTHIHADGDTYVKRVVNVDF